MPLYNPTHIVNDLELQLDAGDEAWGMKARQDGLGLPAVVLRPLTGTDENIAFDLMPKGAPGNSGTNGVCWIDVCNDDAELGNTTEAARIGVFADGSVEFGSRAFSSGTAGAVKLCIAATTMQNITTTKTTIYPQGSGSAANSAAVFEVNHATTGTSAYAASEVKADTATGALRAYSSTFSFDTNSYQNAVQVAADGAGGLVLSAGNAAGVVSVLTGGSARSSQTRLEVGAAGDIWIGTQSVMATNATAGFFHMRGGAGAPSGAPANTKTGLTPFYVDTTNFRLYGRFSGTWKQVTFA